MAESSGKLSLVQSTKGGGSSVPPPHLQACGAIQPEQVTEWTFITVEAVGLWDAGALSAAVLDEVGSPIRFSRVLEKVKGVSQKSLTKTLRLLEQDGLVKRTIFAEVPPRVEYALTDLGREISEGLGGKYVDLYEFPDGRLEVRSKGRVLPYRVFDKDRRVNAAAVVENKRLGHALSLIEAQQDQRPAPKYEPTARKMAT